MNYAEGFHFSAFHDIIINSSEVQESSWAAFSMASM